MIEFDKLRCVLLRLQERNEKRNELAPSKAKYEVWVIESVDESTIQRFEVAWGILWKTLGKYLEVKLELEVTPYSPNRVLVIANENNLLPSDIDQWQSYNQARIDTSHDYSLKKAESTLKVVDEFVEDAIELYEELSGEGWS